MTFRRFDAGIKDRPKNGDKGDCQVRALATARSMPYAKAWEILYALQGERMACSFPLVERMQAGDERLGFLRKLSFPAKRGQPRMTGGKFCEKHPRGRFILRMGHHVVAVKEGILYDTFDTSLNCVYVAWAVSEWEEEVIACWSSGCYLAVSDVGECPIHGMPVDEVIDDSITLDHLWSCPEHGPQEGPICMLCLERNLG